MPRWWRHALLAMLYLLPTSTLAAAAGSAFPIIPHTGGEIFGLSQSTRRHPGITGDWGGARNQLEDQGITVAALYTGESERNYDPGLVKPRLETIYHDNLDLMLTVDTEKAGLWPGGTLFIYGLRNHGGQPSQNVIGDLQVASNIEAPQQFIVEEAWYEQKLMHGKLSLLAGLRDVNNEFYISDYGTLFINSSFGIGPEIATNVPTSTFPRAGWGARIRIKPSRHWYVQVASFGGNPQRRTLAAHDGQMLIAEAGLILPKGRYKLGAWTHTATHVYAGHSYAGDYGGYALIDQQLAAIGAMKIGAFVQYGWVPPGRNLVTRYLGLGLHILALLPWRTKDIFGLGLAEATTHTGTENTIELTYRMPLTPWLVVQPSFQWIANPGAVTGNHMVRVGILHFELSF